MSYQIALVLKADDALCSVFNTVDKGGLTEKTPLSLAGGFPLVVKAILLKTGR